MNLDFAAIDLMVSSYRGEAPSHVSSLANFHLIKKRGGVPLNLRGVSFFRPGEDTPVCAVNSELANRFFAIPLEYENFLEKQNDPEAEKLRKIKKSGRTDGKTSEKVATFSRYFSKRSEETRACRICLGGCVRSCIRYEACPICKGIGHKTKRACTKEYNPLEATKINFTSKKALETVSCLACGSQGHLNCV